MKAYTDSVKEAKIMARALANYGYSVQVWNGMTVAMELVGR
jgi:hypothetical protein